METEDFIDFYFSELLSWLDKRTEPIGSPIYTQRDYFRRYDIFPPTQEKKEKPYAEFWPAINTWDLKIEKERAKDRTYRKSPSHHVFLITMLELVNDYPESLIEMYAREKGLYKLMAADPVNGDIKCLELFIDDLKIYLENKKRQLIPLLYHGHPGGILMSADLEVVAQSPRPASDTMYEFGFSKESSDAFTTALIKQLTERIRYLQEIHKLPIKPAPNIPGAAEITIKAKGFSAESLKNKSLSFEDLFLDVSQAHSIIQLLKNYNIISEAEAWIGLTGKNTEVLALIDVLAEKKYIRKYNQTQVARPFCQKFSIQLTDRSLRSKHQVYYDTIDEYRRIIPDLK